MTKWRITPFALLIVISVLTGCGSTVTYNGNGNTGGTVPIDSNTYLKGQSVTVLGNTGSLVKTGFSFSGWNTQANGSGTTYTQGQTFILGGSSVTLYALWSSGQSSSIGAPLDWSWVSGSNYAGQSGVYGAIGTTAAANVPRARNGSASWIDSNGNFWLFGGEFQTSGVANPCLNDLWKYSSGEWTWMSGSNTYGQMGTYGSQGVASSTNVPGARYGAASWIDSNNNLWLFGGSGLDASSGTFGYFNDLWNYNIANGQWTWVSGSTVMEQTGNYGSIGVASTTNAPAARYGAVSWIDSNNNLWLFGGNAVTGYMNDLWEYDTTAGEWTWMSGSSTPNQRGTYRTSGSSNASNVPGQGQWLSPGWIPRITSGYLEDTAMIQSVPSLLI